ncbi:(4Fe-4S)-binding protein [Algibacter amylolyticus]|uniref:(4Fe-4S)-binding protein n=1 Tax=Algibacter amylolyticus TaxID=1608400 RepID=A0A5M7B5I1_9FLAO|nr:(4Fe-4S)-binding protein [Algibacter amylolyticus]KAA5824020.1 (4Fe-4S)-binding protein [Algibacter amylolyticus]MBB5269572.1 putative Fe-S cluster protein YjdI [Algibacter amylolyticus]TSJ74497.1 (4Fe-4S)-binding protein [Algibacter amylolyticus]
MNIEYKTFKNKEVTVTYDPRKCELSGTCSKELSDVFSDSIIPWVNLENTETEKIIKQIKKCPSGALKFRLREKATY